MKLTTAPTISRNVRGAMWTKLEHATRPSSQLAVDNACTATAALSKPVPQMQRAPAQNPSIAITFTTCAFPSTRAPRWCRRVREKSATKTMNSAPKITAAASCAMKITAIGRRHRSRRHAIASMSCMRRPCLLLLFSGLCCPSEIPVKFQIILFILTRCAYAKCHVTLIAEPATNDVRVNPKSREETKGEREKKCRFSIKNSKKSKISSLVSELIAEKAMKTRFVQLFTENIFQ